MMPGVQRKSIEAGYDELEKYFIGSPSKVLKRVHEILRTIILDLLTDAQCAVWGDEAQKQYSQLTQKALAVATSTEIRDSGTHLARLYAILEELSMAIQGKEPKGLRALITRPPHPGQLFEQRRPELLQLSNLLDMALPKIAAVEAEAASLATEFTELAAELDAYSLAAKYMAEKLLDPTAKANAIQLLQGRSSSLTLTVAHIRQDAVVRSQTHTDYQRLSERIREGVRNELPAWMSSFTAVFQRQTQTDTDRNTLQSGLEVVLQRLK